MSELKSILVAQIKKFCDACEAPLKTIEEVSDDMDRRISQTKKSGEKKASSSKSRKRKTHLRLIVSR